MREHHVLIILILAFSQGHTDRTRENNKCIIISETIKAMSIKFAVKIVRLKVSMSMSLCHRVDDRDLELSN